VTSTKQTDYIVPAQLPRTTTGCPVQALLGRDTTTSAVSLLT